MTLEPRGGRVNHHDDEPTYFWCFCCRQFVVNVAGYGDHADDCANRPTTLEETEAQALACAAIADLADDDTINNQVTA